MTMLESTVDSAVDPLGSVWCPRSVAVVGASDNPAKWGHWLAAGALLGQDAREVHLVNRRGRPVCGVSTARALHEVSDPPELVAICVPPTAVERSVDEALESGARALLVITDGITSHDPGLPAELANRARAAGARLIGPSSLGIVDTAHDLRLAWGRFAAGPVAVITQSGQVGSELAHLLARHGSGISRFASVGAQLDVTAEELLAGLVDDPGTHAALAYLEQIRDPAAFLKAAADLREAGKPLILLTAGTSAAGSAAARSHTGALTSDVEVLDAACRAVGAVRAATPARAATLAHALIAGVRPRGARIAIISDSGGQGALAADAATESGLDVPSLAPPPSKRIRAVLPHEGSIGNPVDLAGAGEQDMTVYVAAAEAAAGDADAVLLTGYFGLFGEDSPSLADQEQAVARRLTRLAQHVPLIVHSMAENTPTLDVLTGGGVPVFTDVELATRTLASCVTWTAAQTRRTHEHRSVATARQGRAADYDTARRRLSDAGIAIADAGVAHSAAEAVAISNRWPGCTVVKAADIAHKTEVGGVVLGLNTADDVARAYRDLRERLGARTVIVERLDERAAVVEMLVGIHRDPTFGPIVMVGAGGVHAELWRDTAIELAPVTTGQAHQALARLHSYPLLRGWRGSPAVDMHALAEAVATISRLPLDTPDIAGCEINPLRAGSDGVLAVDALLTYTADEETR